MSENDLYEPVIGLEIHAQLLTKSKLFCGDAVSFGDTPNSHVSAISLAHPGTLPRVNKEAVKLAIRLGLALNCQINRHSVFARKNYFYPDLPKGFQTSQHTEPICKGGRIPLNADSTLKSGVALHHIHLEEDAGKSIHDVDDLHTCIDLNRAGVALVEIVTEPDIFSSSEAYECLTMIRKIVRHLEVCDGNMEEGSLRCDANISIRKKGEKNLGTKVEIKNLNSIRNVKRAIDHEIERQTKVLKRGEKITQETRSFDAETGSTFSLRTKEQENDYRYFAEPDIPPVHISEDEIAQILASSPMLPHEWETKLITQYHLPPSSAALIADEVILRSVFLIAVENTKEYGIVANWLIGPVKSYFNEQIDETVDEKKLSDVVVQLTALTANNQVAFSMAASHIFPNMMRCETSALELAKQKNLLQVNDSDELQNWIEQVLQKMPEKVSEYKKGKTNLIGLFAGEVKKASQGKADMKQVINILKEKLNKDL